MPELNGEGRLFEQLREKQRALNVLDLRFARGLVASNVTPYLAYAMGSALSRGLDVSGKRGIVHFIGLGQGLLQQVCDLQKAG